MEKDKEIKLKCPAKINLTLEILDKRLDGFHNIQSVMQTIDLFDILTIKIEKSENFEIKLSGTSDEIPYDERNLVHKAVELFASKFPRPCGERVRVRGQYQEIYDQVTLNKAKALRKNTTDAEKILWTCLRNRQLNNLKFRRQVPIGIYIADFVCKEEKLIVELDGSGHVEKKQIEHDLKRTQFFESEGYKVIRFFNTDIFKNLEGVVEVILNAKVLPLTPTLSPQGRGSNAYASFADNKISISIHIEKNIPIAAGLAGGSTDAAGTLWGLNKLFDNVFSSEEIHKMCAQLGSDLNFCLEGGCQLTTGRGEILENLNMPESFKEYSLSLIKPKDLGISAKEAYTKFSELESKPNLNMTQKFMEALKKGEDIEEFLHNDLEISLVRDYSQLREIRMEYPEAIMSGSGSTFFALDVDFKDFDDNFWIKNGLKLIPYGVCEG